jgi:hypothetical protein
MTVWDPKLNKPSYYKWKDGIILLMNLYWKPALDLQTP